MNALENLVTLCSACHIVVEHESLKEIGATCVPADHLFVGHKGQRNPQAKLKDDSIRSIRRQAAAGYSRKILALDYGVSATMIYNIIRGKSWSHVI